MSTQKQSKVDPSKISILKINILKSNIDSPLDYIPDHESGIGFTMSLGNEIKYDTENKMVRIRLFLSFEETINEEEKTGLKADFGIEFHFYVGNLDENLVVEDKDTKINKVLIATLMGMAYSSSRGIILERTSNTYFKGLIIPSIDPYQALEDAL